MAKLRIAIADDHTLMRAGLAALVNAQRDMEVIGEAANCDEAIQLVERAAPDVLTLDLTMPGGNSVKTIQAIHRQFPTTKVLVLTMHDEVAYLRATLAAGAAGYLVKTATDAEMLTALRAIAQGRTFINLSIANDKGQAVLGDDPSGSPTKPDGLSAREIEVLKQLARGHTNQEIADKLFLSVKTIETYRSRIGVKLGLRTRADIVAYATESGLLKHSELD